MYFLRMLHRDIARFCSTNPVTIHASKRGPLAFTVGTIIALAIQSPAKATVIASETFDYGVGSSLTGQNGGTGWAGVWTNTGGFGSLTIESNTQTYPGFASSGNRAAAPFADETDQRALTAPAESFGQVIWLSVEASFVSSAAGFPNVRFSTPTGPSTVSNAFALGGNNFLPNWSLLGSNLDLTNGGVESNVPLNGSPAFALVEIDYATDTTSLWMDPNLGTFNGTQSPSVVGDFASNFSDVGLFVGTGDSVESVRIGTTYGDVIAVPEPISIAVFGAGLLGLAAVYRQRAVDRQKAFAPFEGN
jgi:hypothetical protein